MEPPSSIAHYHITSKLGEGGMGAVYRATDTRLNRDVAIKILPPAFAEDAARMQRFEREAQLLASLNHPNIATVYGIEQGALVMELVEGADLRGPLPLDDVVAIARQIATGLEAAHERGVIHRDLKPANIKVTPAGVVKLLDFGLAKSAGDFSVAASATAGSPSISPTLSVGMTQAGMILGTAAYMSPEQARGKPVDKRSDIWAFGVVLYEILTGTQLFGGGETVADTLASVVKDAPDLNALPAGTPPYLRALLERCLRKDVNTRLRDIGEARVLLESPPPVSSAPEAPVRTQSRWPIVAAMVMTAVAALAFWAPWRQERVPEQSLVNLEVDLGPDARLPGERMAISPDGKRIVFRTGDSGDRALLSVRRLDQAKAAELAGAVGGRYPFFSPDGLWIAFFADGMLKKISVEGGAAVTLCPAAGGMGGTWREDGTILFNRDTSGPLWRVSAAGGEPVAATKLGPGDFSHRWPQTLPGGQVVLVTSTKRPASSEGASVDVVTLPDRKVKTLVRDAIFGRYLPSGHLIWMRGGTLFAAPFDRQRLEIRGEPIPVIERVDGSSRNSSASFDVSETGILVYRSGTVGTRLATIQWIDASGHLTPLLTKPGYYSALRLSPDGNRLAITVEDTAGADLLIYDLVRETLSTLTRGVGPLPPVWSPDGEFLALSGCGSCGKTSSWIRVDGAAPPGALVTNQEGEQNPASFHPDGRLLLFDRALPRSADLWMLPVTREGAGLRPGKAELLLQGARGGHISPDGKWLAYSQGRVGATELYVTAFKSQPSMGSRWQIASGQVSLAFWSRSASELFYSERNEIMAVSYRVKGDVFVAEKPRVWAKLPGPPRSAEVDLAPDGKRFVVAAPVEDLQAQNQQSHVIFLLNFFEELRRKAPVH